MQTPDGMPSIAPVLFYTDLGKAAEWLCKTFGFEERVRDRVVDERGVVQHAELELGDGLVILSAVYDEFQVPTENSIHHQLLYVFVDDVDGHAMNASENSAVITRSPSDTNYGARVYSARDYEGHHWIFAQQL